MSRPQALKKGDIIQVVAPSRWVDEELLLSSVDFLSSLGYRPRHSEALLNRQGQFAGPDNTRCSDLIDAWQNEEVKALWVARGGYGAQRIVDGLADAFKSGLHKWLIGFSDTTALHGLLTKSGLCGLHAPVLSTISKTNKKDVEELFNILSGKNPSEIHLPNHDLNTLGASQGRLIGGNLSVLHSMIATPSMPSFNRAILFIEDVDEMLYHLDRMILQFKRIGLLQSLAGVLVGGMTDMRDNTIAHGFRSDNPYGSTAMEIIAHNLKDLDIPIAFGMPCGHGTRNHPLILGSKVSLMVDDQSTRLSYA